MGYQIEVHPEGAPLNSYYSDQEAKVANIIIRRDQLRGAYGDVGFVRQPDGQFAVIKDELDEYRSAALQGEADLGHGAGEGLHAEKSRGD